MALDFAFVGQHFDPAHAVGIGPHRVVDAGEIHRQLAAAFFEKVRQQETHFEKRQRIFRRDQQLVPNFCRRRHQRRRRNEFIRGVGRGAAGRADGADQDDEKLQRARHLPAAQVSRRRVAPDMRRKSRAGLGDFMRHFDNHFRIDAGFFGGEFRRVLSVESLSERAMKV